MLLRCGRNLPGEPSEGHLNKCQILKLMAAKQVRAQLWLCRPTYDTSAFSRDIIYQLPFGPTGGAHEWHTRLYYSRLFLGYVKQGIPQNTLVIKCEACYYRDERRHNIGCVEAAAHTHLDHGNIN